MIKSLIVRNSIGEMSAENEQNEKLVKLGQRVKEIRTLKGLTLKDLSHSIGKDPQSIHRLEVGGVNPSYLYLTQLCEGLGINVWELLEGL